MSGNPAAYLTADDFTAELQALLPPGPAWDGTLMAALMAGVGEAFGTLHAWIATITEIEMVPNTADMLLPDWEYDFGLPDGCTPLAPTIPQRQAALIAKMQALGGQSAPYFIGLAAALGFTVTITRIALPFYNQASYGASYYNQPWRFVWQVNVPTTSAAAAELVCRLSTYQPALGRVIFSYAI